jgi:hypothetical protein
VNVNENELEIEEKAPSTIGHGMIEHDDPEIPP